MTTASTDSLADVPNPKPTRAVQVWQVFACVLLGGVVAVVGTGVHRVNQPWGLVLAYLTVFSAAVLARAWGRVSAFVGLGTGLTTLLFAMAFWRPGGDVLVTDHAIGWAWIAAPVVLLVVAALPQRLFSDRPVNPRRDPGQPS